MSRAVGFRPQLEIDYLALPLAAGDVFLLASDGVYEHADAAAIAAAIRHGRTDLDRAARAIVEEALRRGSDDNLTVQIVAVDELPAPEANQCRSGLAVLALTVMALLFARFGVR